MFAEYHPQFARNRVPPGVASMIDVLPTVLNYVKNYTSGCNVDFIEIDDESYAGCRDLPCTA